MVSLILILDFLVLVCSLAAFLAIRDYQIRRGHPYPPGPRPLPIIGNLLDIPKEFSWLSYIEHSKKYGDILSFHIFGQVIVVLNSFRATKDLLEKRGDIYSDRPVIPICEMMKWDWVVPVAGYTEFWRQTRKLLDRGLRPAATSVYRPLQQTKARVLLVHLLSKPDEWEAHLEHLTGELILELGYGFQVQGRDDWRIKNARKLAQLAGEVINPGALLVNDLPILRHIPEWLSWFSYKPLARQGRDLGQAVMHGPLTFARECIVNGTARPSLALDNLQETEKLQGEEREKADKVVAGALGSIYAAGTDTTVSSVMSFFVAVLRNTEIQTKAQAEIDAVTGRERLPTFDDRPRLPYVDAICRELLRWRPPIPLAVPHAATEDNVYEGYFIPKGAMIIGNAWAILHNPTMYPDPEAFKPDRFLNADGSLRDDPVLSSTYGFGRRICPGRYFVDSTLFIVIASLLSVFKIEKPKGTDGGPDVYPYTGFGITRPKSLSCSIVPRDRRAEELIVTESLAH